MSKSFIFFTFDRNLKGPLIDSVLFAHPPPEYLLFVVVNDLASYLNQGPILV